MTRYRLIKWLTILMLALSLAIVGAWMWAGRVPILNQPGLGSAILIRVYQDGAALIPWREAMRMPDGDRLPISGTITGSVRTYSNPGAISNGRIILPTHLKEEVLLNWTPSKDDSSGRFKPIQELSPETLVDLALRDQRDLLPRMYGERRHLELLLAALRRGPGTRNELYGPGVAQRVRIWSPRALAITGFLTLAGFTTLFFHRRALRNRLRTGHCLNCDYDLRGLASPTNCPECGNTLPPSPAPSGGGAERSEAEGVA